MKLLVATPLERVVDEHGVVSVRAEDSTGMFGLLAGHVDFVTVLAPSVLTWRGEDGVERHVAVQGGVLTMSDGDRIEVATRRATVGDDLEVLEADVLARFEEEAASESLARTHTARLQAAAIRRITQALRLRGPSGRWDLEREDR